MPSPRLVAAKTFFSRMNEGRKTWLNESDLLNSCEQYFRQTGYSKITRDRKFEGTSSSYVSPIVGTKEVDNVEIESLVTYLSPRIEKFDSRFESSIESALFDIIDNYDGIRLVLATDSLSYFPITKNPELNIAFENLMDEGLSLLLLNGHSGYALFDEFSKLTAPIEIID